MNCDRCEHRIVCKYKESLGRLETEGRNVMVIPSDIPEDLLSVSCKHYRRDKEVKHG